VFLRAIVVNLLAFRLKDTLYLYKFTVMQKKKM